MITNKIDYNEFVGQEYNINKTENYIIFFQESLDTLNLSDTEKNDIANGWMYATILIANTPKILTDYQILDITSYILVEKYVKLGNQNIDWEMTFKHILNAYPNREYALRLLGGHRHSNAWEKMQSMFLDGILNQASTKIEQEKRHIIQLEKQRRLD